MNLRSVRLLGTIAAVALIPVGSAWAAASPAASTQPSHHPHFMPLITGKPGAAVVPPALPCPLPSGLPTVPSGVPLVGGIGVGQCVKAPELPATGAPVPGNMAYWGGRVQVHPHIYLVFFGWGEKGAFKKACAPEALNERTIHAVLKCDPDGAGKRMADFVSQLGGTPWAGVQSQYYQEIGGVRTYVQNDKAQLAGIWTDDVNKTSKKISYHDMAAEAERAQLHFHVGAARLPDSNFVIVQPQNFSDPVAQADGYCAFHDLIRADVDKKDYHGLRPNVAYTNMPYVLNQGTGCGENLVNAGKAGVLDGFTVALGHEIEETVTDPGAGDVIGQTPIGGWIDPLDSDEDGDKCAYVGDDPTGAYAALTGGAGTIPIPGSSGNIRGNRGGMFPVQSLWSNDSAEGLGYCAGAGTDLPTG